MGSYNVSLISEVKETKMVECELHEPQSGQVLVKVDYCAICTLEQRIYNGVMKRYPFAGGHEAAGTVEAVGPGVKGVKAGDKVAIRLLTSCGECYYCRSGHENQCVISFKAETHEGLMGPGGFAQYMMLSAKYVYKMADDVDMTAVALTEPLACCVHSANNAHIGFGNDVVVIGVGIMGAFHIQLAKLRGARVIACEVDEARLKVAKELGADILINPKTENAVARIKELTDGRGADVVFCTVALSASASESLDMVGKLGRVIYYSSFHPDTPIEFSPNKVHSAETIITGSVNPGTADFLAASRLISFGLVNTSLLISDVLPLSQIDEAFKKAVDPSTYRILVKCN